ncbi:putative b(0,+)-type amino acid transporter 1 isoform X3 [Apostichopus japonicus]|uniref:b(0,+)-type amino acid transporter 1 n=1 Tax=Stichopus japonicus TaxID=307972 RepID=A0A2G8K0G3_STIJA|nr:putative b(0,+)-type amino acid transporter 1 isoform X3 [Apostichopus japonicus]
MSGSTSGSVDETKYGRGEKEDIAIAGNAAVAAEDDKEGKVGLKQKNTGEDISMSGSTSGSIDETKYGRGVKEDIAIADNAAVAAEDDKEGKVGLKRQITLLGAVSIIVGSMIGSGIFVSPVGVLRQTESVGMSLIIWVLCGALSTIGALCYAELGTIIPKSGGEFPYLYDTYGPALGFLYAWVSTILMRPSSLSIISLTFAEYFVQPFFAADDCDPPLIVIKMMGCVCVILIVFVNCASVKAATNVQVIFTAAKLIALCIIIIVGFVELGKGNTEYLNPKTSFKGSSSNVFAYGIAFYQDSGHMMAGTSSSRKAFRKCLHCIENLPLGIIIGIPLVTVVYLLTNIAYFAVMSPAEMLSTSAVAVTFANRTLGPVAWIIPVFVCCSTFGAANGTLFTAGRLAYVAGREGHTLEILSMVHTKLITPQPALMFTGVLAIAMLIPNDFDTLVNYFSFSAWIFYGLATLAVIVLRFRHPEWKRPVKVPLVLPIIFVIASVYLVIAPIIDSPEFGYLYASIFIIAGLFLYYPLVYRKYSPKVMGHITTFFQRLLQVAPSYYVAPEDDISLSEQEKQM